MKNKRNVILPGIVLIIIAVLLAIFIYKYAQGPAANTFLSGGSKGKGMGLYAPSSLQADPNSTNYVKYMYEYYPGTKNTKTTIAATTASVADSKNTATQLQNELKSKKGSAYVDFISTQGTLIRNFSAMGNLSALDVSNPSNNQLTLRSAVAFTNKHIKNNAWHFDYTITRKTSEGKTAKVDGELIYAIGNKAAYRLMVSSVDDAWLSDKSTWKKVFDSLRIDQ